MTEVSEKIEPEDEGAVADAPARGAGGHIASFSGQLFIDTTRRLEHLDQGPVKAFAASGNADVSQPGYFALLCEPSLIPRSRMAASYAAVMNGSLLKLVASGPIYWPPSRGERYVFIYEMPPAKPMTPYGQFKGLDLKADTVESSIVKPLIYTLLDMRDSDIIHGNVNPANIFVSGVGGNIDRVILGDCLSLPPSYNQHIYFETVERAMLDPVSRGLPSLEHDMYALGVSLAVMLRSRDPMAGMSNDDIIHHKIEHGSYISLTGKDRFTGSILELLRGLLNDDRAQRWGIDEVISWLDGQRLNPKAGSKKIKAARPIHFEGERYLRPAVLALDFKKNPSEAVQLIESDTLTQWVSRSLEDPLVEKRLESALETVSEQGRGPGYADRLLCRVSIALDPEGPIRYKDLNVHPEGFGHALAQTMITKGDVQPYVDLINQQAVMFWLSSQGETNVDIGSVVSKFDACRAFLRQPTIAYGLERCLYFLCSECPCISEKLKDYYVRNEEDMMKAFEQMSSDPKRPHLFFDRHIVAFLSVKDRKDVDPFLMELNSDDMYKKTLGNIKTLATIQQRGKLDKYPGICQWIYEILDPVFERYHDRELRKNAKIKIQSLIDKGDIAKIAAILDNAETNKKDTDTYNKARTEYYNLRVEDAKLAEKLDDPILFTTGVGREIGAIVSCIIAGLVMMVFIFLTFAGGGIF